MARQHGKALVLALSALIGLIAGEARAEVITFTIDIPGFTIDATPFTSPVAGHPAGTAFTVDVNALNAVLAADGSAYQFSSLGGMSNFPGGAAGSLILTYGVGTLLTGNNTSLKITETEAGFTSPPPGAGVLTSASGGTFLQGPGGTLTSSSSFNSTHTPDQTFTAVGDNFPFSRMNQVGVPITTLYSLDNVATISNLPLAVTTAGGVTNPSIGGSVSAIVSAVPEPTSIVMLLTGMPLPLVVMGLVRRFRRQVA